MRFDELEYFNSSTVLIDAVELHQLRLEREALLAALAAVLGVPGNDDLVTARALVAKLTATDANA